MKTGAGLNLYIASKTVNETIQRKITVFFTFLLELAYRLLVILHC